MNFSPILWPKHQNDITQWQTNRYRVKEIVALMCFLKLKTKNYLNSSELILRFIFCAQMICLNGRSLPNHTPIQVLILMQVAQSIGTQHRVWGQMKLDLFPRTKLHGGKWILVGCTTFTALPYCLKTITD